MCSHYSLSHVIELEAVPKSVPLKLKQFSLPLGIIWLRQITLPAEETRYAHFFTVPKIPWGRIPPLEGEEGAKPPWGEIKLVRRATRASPFD